MLVTRTIWPLAGAAVVELFVAPSLGVRQVLLERKGLHGLPEAAMLVFSVLILFPVPERVPGVSIKDLYGT